MDIKISLSTLLQLSSFADARVVASANKSWGSWGKFSNARGNNKSIIPSVKKININLSEYICIIAKLLSFKWIIYKPNSYKINLKIHTITHKKKILEKLLCKSHSPSSIQNISAGGPSAKHLCAKWVIWFTHPNLSILV